MEKLKYRLEDLLSEICDNMCEHRRSCTGEEDAVCETCVLDEISNLFEKLKQSEENFRIGYARMLSRVKILAEENETLKKQQVLYQSRIRAFELKFAEKLVAEEDLPGPDAYIDHDFIERRFSEVK